MLKQLFTRTSLLFFLLMLLAGALRCYRLDRHSIVGDEVYTLMIANYLWMEGGNQAFLHGPDDTFSNQDWQASHSLSDAMASIAHMDNGNGFLYQLLLHQWVQVFGYEDAGLRSLSVGIGLLLLASIYWIAKRLFHSNGMALLALALSGISPFMLAYAQVARAYVLLFLLSLWANYVYFSWFKKTKISQGSFALYAILVSLSMFCHYSIFFLYLLHGLFWWIYFWSKDLKRCLHYSLWALLPAGLLGLWLLSPGGAYSFDAIALSKQGYMELASKGKDAWIQWSEGPAILRQWSWSISLILPLFDGWALHWQGLKNLALTIGLGLAVQGLFMLFKTRPWYWSFLSLMGTLVLLVLLLSAQQWAFIGIFFSLVLGLQALQYWPHWTALVKAKGALFLACSLSLVLFAYMDETTQRMMPRYVGYAWPLALFFLLGLSEILWKQGHTARVLLLVFFSFGIFGQVMGLWKYFQDQNPAYFHTFSKERPSNPYRLVAQKIEAMYQEGDVVIYPSYPFENPNPAMAENSRSVQVAQLVNLYLQKSPKRIVQRIELQSENQVWLLSSKGEKRWVHTFDDPLFYRF